jgi:hypothetical protein
MAVSPSVANYFGTIITTLERKNRNLQFSPHHAAVKVLWNAGSVSLTVGVSGFIPGPVSVNDLRIRDPSLIWGSECHNGIVNCHGKVHCLAENDDCIKVFID